MAQDQQSAPRAWSCVFAALPPLALPRGAEVTDLYLRPTQQPLGGGAADATGEEG